MDWDSSVVKRQLWVLFKPALVAMIVALLVSMGYYGLTQPTVMVAGVTHYGSMVLSGDLDVAGITVGTYVGALSFYGAISSTVAITNAQVIPYTGRLVIPVTVADGGVGGSIAGTLSATDSISDGTYLGQILYLVNVDADTDTLVIKDAANTELGAADITLGPQDSVTLYWDGTVWRVVAKCDV